MTITNNNPFNVFNYEFKAKAANLAGMENELLNLHPVFAGEDYQVDTYFNTTTGRLKLREGNIENALIYYERKDDIEAKQSDVILYDHAPAESLKNILVKLHGIKVIVKKKRRIYFVENVKFHFDYVENLGTFVEVEAKGENGADIQKLKDQCAFYFSLFKLHATEYIDNSYSDLLLKSCIY